MMAGWRMECASEDCNEDFVKGSVLMQAIYMPHITRREDPDTKEIYLLHRPLGWLTPESVRILDLASARVVKHTDSLPYRVGEPASDDECVLPPKVTSRKRPRDHPKWVIDQDEVARVEGMREQV
jgi:hypothetical protein